MDRQCPKCGKVSDNAVQCSACGVVFAKYQARQEALAKATAEPWPSQPVQPRKSFAWVAYAGTAALALGVGFFGGYMYANYQMMRALAGAVGAVAGAATASTASPSSPPPAQKVPKVAPIITAELVAKTFRDRDYSATPIVTDAILLTVAFRNSSDKAVRAFDGKITFTDLLDHPIFTSSVSISDPIEANGAMTWKGAVEFNQFMSDHKQLRHASITDMKTKFEQGKVLFTDGTTLEGASQ